MKSQAYETVLVPASLIYGGSTSLILSGLSKRYLDETGVRARHWVMRLYPNGAAVPVPTQVTPSVLPDVRVRQLFKQTLDQITELELRRLDEADTVTISVTHQQLRELGLVQAA